MTKGKPLGSLAIYVLSLPLASRRCICSEEALPMRARSRLDFVPPPLPSFEHRPNVHRLRLQVDGGGVAVWTVQQTAAFRPPDEWCF